MGGRYGRIKCLAMRNTLWAAEVTPHGYLRKTPTLWPSTRQQHPLSPHEVDLTSTSKDDEILGSSVDPTASSSNPDMQPNRKMLRPERLAARETRSESHGNIVLPAAWSADQLQMLSGKTISMSESRVDRELMHMPAVRSLLRSLHHRRSGLCGPSSP